MLNPSYVLLYVNDVPASATFYSQLLGAEPVESHPTFALFVCESGLKLGLWIKGDVQPAASPEIGGSELVFNVDARKAVDELHATWSGREIAIAQRPTDLDFGYTFVALDPDGHRLRVFAPRAD